MHTNQFNQGINQKNKKVQQSHARMSCCDIRYINLVYWNGGFSNLISNGNA